MFYVTLLSVRKLVFCVLVVSTSISPYWRHIQSALNSLGNSLGACPPGERRNEGKFDFLGLVVLFGCWVRFLPPHLYKSCGWLGCGYDDKFSFLRERSERKE